MPSIINYFRSYVSRSIRDVKHKLLAFVNQTDCYYLYADAVAIVKNKIKTFLEPC